MCGIAGTYGSPDRRTIMLMTEVMSHRGPDSKGIAITGRHALGSTRLHIIGKGDVPVPYLMAGKSIYVLLNGEIYNYRSWQQELRRNGYCFETDTDTEVAGAMYEQFGPGFVRHLKGMFALAILDNDRLLLARDHLGIKPLYYLRHGGNLSFASEIKALLRIPGVQPAMDIASLQEIVTFGYVNSLENTPFYGIKQVKPGHILLFDGQRLVEKCYYDPPLAFSGDFSKESYQEQKSTLYDLLLACMESIVGHGDQEKGVYLSGGVDSTLMAVLVKKIAGRVKTFTLADSPEAPDLLSARQVAEAIGGEHHEFSTDLQEYLQELPRFVYHYENLIAGGVFDLQGGPAFHLLSKKASQYVKVAMSGEGADELFGGYYWTYTHPLGFADRVRRNLERALRVRPNPRLQDEIDRIFPRPEDNVRYRLNILDLLLRGGLTNYHLWSVDRSGAAFGFEIRPFYLHQDIVNLALSLPVEAKIPCPEVTKFLLKDVARIHFAEFGLDTIVNRKKYGMPAALRRVHDEFCHYVAAKVPDHHVQKHPYRLLLETKVDVLMFDLFYYIFCQCGGRLPTGFSLEEALEGGIFENMYA